MADTRDKIKDGIDDAAHAAKKGTDKAAESVKDAAGMRPARRSRRPARI